MARPLRIEYAGAYYHVTARGNVRKEIFKTSEQTTPGPSLTKEGPGVVCIRPCPETIRKKENDL